MAKKQSGTPAADDQAGQAGQADPPPAAPAEQQPDVQSETLKRLLAARRKPTQLATAVDCLQEARASLDATWPKAWEESGLAAHLRDLIQRAEALIGIGYVR